MNEQNYDLNAYKPTESKLHEANKMEEAKDNIAQTKTLMQLKNQANIIKTSNNQVQTVIENINSESTKFQVIVMVIIVVIIVIYCHFLYSTLISCTITVLFCTVQYITF